MWSLRSRVSCPGIVVLCFALGLGACGRQGSIYEDDSGIRTNDAATIAGDGAAAARDSATAGDSSVSNKDATGGTPAVQRGELISQAVRLKVPALELAAIYLGKGVPLPIRSDVWVYALTYKTIDPNGRETIASGAVTLPYAIPLTNNLVRPMAVVSYLHGTAVEKAGVPSVLAGLPLVDAIQSELMIGLAVASSFNWVGVLPDYVGLGVSPGMHPYLHAATEASAALDFLRATRTFLKKNIGIDMPAKLFITGYSQGGHSAMATLRELEKTTEFPVTAAAPMSGPYDLSGTTMQGLLAKPVGLPVPYYAPYLLVAYNHVYRFYSTDAQLFTATYSQTIPPLFDGKTDGGVINAALPANVLDAFNPAIVAALRGTSDNSLKRALRENDVYNWKPKAPVRLYYCNGDNDVNPLNATVAEAAMTKLGAHVQRIQVAGGANMDHVACALPSLVDGANWFASFK